LASTSRAAAIQQAAVARLGGTPDRAGELASLDLASDEEMFQLIVDRLAVSRKD
jgi:hypothetical protein